MKVRVLDSTEPKEILDKDKPWFNGMHRFRTVKIDTPAQPKNLSICVGDTVKTGEKIG
jgi:hypothetical protein